MTFPGNTEKTPQRPVLPASWPILCVINLVITAGLGLIMRYKIIFPLPALDLGNTLQAHAHFVFSAWVGLTLLSCIVTFVLPENTSGRKLYRVAFYLLELASFGMLFAFLIKGYNAYSIALSTLSVFAFIVFIVRIWKDSNHPKVPAGVRLFLKGAMLWYLLSLPGTFALVYFNLTGNGTPFSIRATFYYFLHFQYNGWFTFCIFALLLSWLHKNDSLISHKFIKIVFWLLALALIPGYGLSILAFYPFLWIEIPSIISVIMHFAAAIVLALTVLKVYPTIHIRMPPAASLLWKIATLAFFLKVIMQAATLVPSLASFAFSFRPLIIGYLHLTFLCFVSFFLIGYLLYYNRLNIKNKLFSGFGLLLFVVSVIVSEAGLFIQSTYAFFGKYPVIFYKIAFWITFGIFFGILLFTIGQFFHKKEITETRS